jgi:hypothetical protein
MYLVPTAATPSPTRPATPDPNEFIRQSVRRKYRISEIAAVPRCWRDTRGTALAVGQYDGHIYLWDSADWR